MAIGAVPSSPGAIAVTAASIGLICGALTVGAILGPTATSSQVAKKPPVSQVAKKPPVETTASAGPLKPEVPAGDKTGPVSVSDCDQQTWPYITHQCLTEREQVAQRKVRVITTDKIAPPVVSAIEQAPKDVPGNEDPAAQKDQPARKTTDLSHGEAMPTEAAGPMVASTKPRHKTTGSVPVPPLFEQSPARLRAEAPHSAPATEPQTVTTTEQSPHAVTVEQPPKVESKNVRHARHKRTREAKQRGAPVRDSDDDYDEPIYSPRSRVVERRTERENFVPSHQTSERRRMITIRGGGDQHPFGSVFEPLLR